MPCRAVLARYCYLPAFYRDNESIEFGPAVSLQADLDGLSWPDTQDHFGYRGLAARAGGIGRSAIDDKLGLAESLLRPKRTLRTPGATQKMEPFVADLPARRSRGIGLPTAQVQTGEQRAPVRVQRRGQI